VSAPRGGGGSATVYCTLPPRRSTTPSQIPRTRHTSPPPPGAPATAEELAERGLARGMSHRWDLAQSVWSARLEAVERGENADRVAGLMRSTAASAGLPMEGPLDGQGTQAS
jgi:hypothetical protein